MQFIDEPKHIGHVLDYMPANNLVELIVPKRIRKDSEIVNDVCMTARVCIDAYCAGKLVLTTPNVEHSCLHLVSVQKERSQLFQCDSVYGKVDRLLNVSDRHAIQHDRFVALEHLLRDQNKLAAHFVTRS